MSRYHINPVSGMAGKCRATKACPFGDLETEHYNSVEEAREAYERVMAAQVLSPAKSKSKMPLPVEEVAAAAEPVLASMSNPQARLAVQRYLRELQEGHSVSVLRDVNEALLKRVPPGSGSLREALMFNKRLTEKLEAYQRATWSSFSSKKSAEASQEESPVVEESEPEDLIQKLLKQQAARRHVRAPGEPTAEEASAARAKETLLAEVSKLAKRRIGRGNEFLVEGDELETQGHRITYLVEEGSLKKLQDGGFTGEVYAGRVSSKEEAAFVKKLSTAGEELVKTFGKEKFAQPVAFEGSLGGPVPGAPSFELIGGGKESNVYLHKPSGMVYKVYHRTSWKNQGARGKESIEDLQSVIKRQEERYQAIDREKLAEEDAEYVPTYFITSDDGRGAQVPMVVQPYLDPDIYVPASGYRLSGEAGVNDLHDGNIRANLLTKRLVLFDCIL